MLGDPNNQPRAGDLPDSTHDRLFRPAQIAWNCRFNRIDYPLMQLQITLAQTSGEYMILSTIQLLRVTLVTRLLLIPLTTLLVITTLVVLVTMIILKPRA